jgi:hypothetical protein
LGARGQDVFNGADRIIEREVAGKTGSSQRRGVDLAARLCRAQSLNLVAPGAVDFHFNFVGIEAVNRHGIILVNMTAWVVKDIRGGKDA